MKKIITFSVIFSFIFITASFADTITTNTTNVPVQLGTSNTQVIQVIPANTSVEKISSTGDWYRVKYNSQTGYVYKAYTAEGLNEISITYPSYGGQSNVKLSSLKSIIEYCKAYCRDNNFIYGSCHDITKITNGNKIDCSAYVSWVLYEYGKANNISSLVDTYDRQNSSLQFNAIGKSLASGGSNKHFTLVNGINNAQLGDILCYNGHVEFYAGSKTGNRAKVYNCGSTNYIRSSSLVTKASRDTSQITYILRLKY